MPPPATPPEPSPRPVTPGGWGRSAPGGTSSLGLSTRQASLLAYSAGWISGLALLALEGRDREVRWHAAQSLLGFGVLTVIGLLLMVLAGASLFTSLALFRVCLWGAQVLIGIGLVLWAWSLLQVALGKSPRWPLIGSRVARLADPSPASPGGLTWSP